MSANQRKVKLEYGFRAGHVVNICELKNEERGLACNCTCPSCGKALIARLGTKKQRHFAHRGDECNLAAAQQTALHMLAKEIIADNCKLLFPGISVKRDQFINDVHDYRVITRVEPSLEYKEAKEIKIDSNSVKLEKRVSDIVPDIIVTVQGKPCLIEVAVTHFVDEDKLRKIKEINLPLMEIDLSELHKKEFSREEIECAVLSDEKNRKWIFNPLFAEANKWAYIEFSKKISDAQSEVEKEDREKIIKEEKKRRHRQAGERKIKELFKPENYSNSILPQLSDEEIINHLRKLHWKVSPASLPFFLNIPITGEMVFPCDRRIWQSTIFYIFVYNRKSKTVNLKKIKKWLTDRNDYFPINWYLTYKTEVSFESGEKKELSLLNDVILKFLNYLEFLGFLDRFLFDEASIKHTYTLSPPDKENERILKMALQKVDLNSPNIDDDISKYIAPYRANKKLSDSKGTANYLKPANSEKNVVVYERREKSEKDIENENNFRKRKLEENIGYVDVKEENFDSNVILRDRYGFRWCMCTSCRNVFREEQMVIYGGSNSVNKGICRECSKKLSEKA